MTNNVAIIDLSSATYSNRVLTFTYNVEKVVLSADYVILKNYPTKGSSGMDYYNHICDKSTGVNGTGIIILEYEANAAHFITTIGNTMRLGSGLDVSGWS